MIHIIRGFVGAVVNPHLPPSGSIKTKKKWPKLSPFLRFKIKSFIYLCFLWKSRCDIFGLFHIVPILNNKRNGSLCSPYLFASLLFSPYLVLETRRRCPLSKARRSITRRVVNKQTPTATTHFSFDPFFLSFHKTNKEKKIMISI